MHLNYATATQDRLHEARSRGLEQADCLDQVAFADRVRSDQDVEGAEFDGRIFEREQILQRQPVDEHARLPLNLSGFRFLPKAGTEGVGGLSVALEAERAHVGEGAFAAAFGDGEDVVGVPEITAGAPVFFELAAGAVVEYAFVFAEGFGVDAALGADAPVAGEDLGAEVAGVGAELPLVDAGGAAEGESALRDFGAAPAAAAAAPVGGPASGLGAAGAHWGKGERVSDGFSRDGSDRLLRLDRRADSPPQAGQPAPQNSSRTARRLRGGGKSRGVILAVRSLGLACLQ